MRGQLRKTEVEVNVVMVITSCRQMCFDSPSSRCVALICLFPSLSILLARSTSAHHCEQPSACLSPPSGSLSLSGCSTEENKRPPLPPPFTRAERLLYFFFSLSLSLSPALWFNPPTPFLSHFFSHYILYIYGSVETLPKQ